MQPEKYIDPHFHIWDVSESSPSKHTQKSLNTAYPLYLPKEYIAEFPEHCQLAKAIFVEAISEDPLAELKWANDFASLFEEAKIDLALVPYADLSNPNIGDLLQTYSTYPRVRGIRQIINHHSNPSLTWPKVSQEYLFNDTWRANFALLAKHQFSFDLQLNPHQHLEAASFLAGHANIPIILNHMGCLHLGQGEAADKEMLQVWRTGIKALAALPNVCPILTLASQCSQVFVKISMLPFVLNGFQKNDELKQQVKDLALEMIHLFGSQRCMFATNFPADKSSVSVEFLWKFFHEIVSNLPKEAQTDLFYSTANNAYRL